MGPRATIHFRAPGRSTVHAVFELPAETVAGCRSTLDANGRLDVVLPVEIRDTTGTLIAQASKSVYSRRTDPGAHLMTELERAIRSSWSADTCDPVDLPDWSAHNAARGQCASTALVIQDHLGGELLLADVLHRDGSPQGVHFWNRLPGGHELDLTRAQFNAGEIIKTPSVVMRAPDTSVGRLAGQYRTLSKRVLATLGEREAPRARSR